VATVDTGRKEGAAVPLSQAGWVPSNTKSPGPRPTSIPSGILIHPAIWPQQIWAENWGLCPVEGGEGGFSSNSVARGEAYLHAKFQLDPSNRSATVHERYRQDRTDWTDRQAEQRSDSIGRTVVNGRTKT